MFFSPVNSSEFPKKQKHLFGNQEKEGGKEETFRQELVR